MVVDGTVFAILLALFTKYKIVSNEIFVCMTRIDCAALVPSMFSSSDVGKLVSLCPCVQRAEKVSFSLNSFMLNLFFFMQFICFCLQESRAISLAETCVISAGFLKVSYCL